MRDAGSGRGCGGAAPDSDPYEGPLDWNFEARLLIVSDTDRGFGGR